MHVMVCMVSNSKTKVLKTVINHCCQWDLKYINHCDLRCLRLNAAFQALRRHCQE